MGIFAGGALIMPIYRLSNQLVFPASELAEPGGLLAVGGDLSPRRLLLAYSLGIFPWFCDDEPPLWWSPDPRCVIFPEEIRISRSLAKCLRQGRFRVSCDTAFAAVLDGCAQSRRGQPGTWITAAMRAAYLRLFRMGYAHSLECWRGDELAGGLYGVVLGRCFFGESMFHRAPDASKVALATLARKMAEWGWPLIDCQLPNPHLLSLGAVEIPRVEFLRRLEQGGVLPGRIPPPGFLPEGAFSREPAD